MQVDWELSQSLVSDSQGIRCACVLPASGDGPDAFRLITGNQGGAMFEFGIPSGNLQQIPFQHNHAISALLASNSNKNPVYVSGCKDTVIRVLDATSHAVLASLEGHSKPVTSLAWADTANKYLISGSWDGTAKVWDLERHCLVATLPDHENSVCVQGLPSTASNKLRLATGSAGEAQNNTVAGFTVRLWEIDVVTGQVSLQEKVANDHHGPIRDICGIMSDGAVSCLATCSNDGTVKLRNVSNGEAMTTLTLIPADVTQQQHPPMLLSVQALMADSTGCLVGSAEDGHVAVWNVEQAEAPQLVVHPDCVWRSVALPNGDFATCCQDGTLRIFTRATDRRAPQVERDAFSDQVKQSQQKQSKDPSDAEIAKLPHWEEQRQQMIGRSEGQVQLFQKNGVAIAAQWSAASRAWIEVGQVMGSNQDAGSIDGVQYDHVLPIEVDTTGGGVAKLQIGYNNGENPFVAAQRFIDAHMLPQHHLAEIADYIQQRTGAQSNPTLGGPAAGAASGMMGAPATAGVPIAAYEYFPPKQYKSFDVAEKTAAATFEKMKTKIQEGGKLSDAQLGSIGTLMDTLIATNRYHASKMEDAELQVLLDMTTQSTPAEAFPFLDLARYAVLHPDAASKGRAAFWDKMVQAALALSENPSGLEGPAAVAIPMLSLRLFANAFKGALGSQSSAAKHMGTILSRADGMASSSNKNIRISVATLLHNVAFYLHSNQGEATEAIVLPMITTLSSIVKNKAYESEALFRAMVALGTIVMASKDAREAAKAAYLTTQVEMAASPHGDHPVKKAAKEVYSLLS